MILPRQNLIRYIYIYITPLFVSFKLEPAPAPAPPPESAPELESAWCRVVPVEQDPTPGSTRRCKIEQFVDVIFGLLLAPKINPKISLKCCSVSCSVSCGILAVIRSSSRRPLSRWRLRYQLGVAGWNPSEQTEDQPGLGAGWLLPVRLLQCKLWHSGGH